MYDYPQCSHSSLSISVGRQSLIAYPVMMNKAKDLNRSSQQSNGSTPTESPVVRRKLLPLRGSVRAQSLPPTDLDFQSESVRPLPVPPELTKDSRSGARCVLAVFLMLFSAYLGSIFFQGPLLPLIVISPKLFRKLVDFTMASWFLLTEVRLCISFLL